MSRCSGFFLLLSPNSTLDQSHSDPSPGLPILFLTTSNDHAMIIMVMVVIMLMVTLMTLPIERCTAFVLDSKVGEWENAVASLDI